MGKGPSVGYWDMAGPVVPRMCLLSAICLPCALPCASPARRWPVEELVGAVGLFRVPTPLAVHVLQVRGTAAQPNVSWAGESHGREGAASPWPRKTWVLHLTHSRTPPPAVPGGDASLLFLLATLQREWLLTGGAGCLCSHCL